LTKGRITTAQTAFPKLYNGPPAPENCPFPSGILTPWHGSLGPPKSTPKMHLDRFSHFCRAHNCDKQTDRSCYSICNNRLHLHTQ